MLEIRPISISKANAFVEQHHRHHGKKTGCRFAIACYEGGSFTELQSAPILWRGMRMTA